MRIFLLLCAFFLVSTTSLSAQNTRTQQIDSLVHLREVPDSQRVHALNQIVWLYAFYKPDSALYFGKQSIALAREAAFRFGEANAQSNTGVAHWVRGEFKEALSRYDSALQLYEKIDSRIDCGKTYNKIGIIHNSQGNYPRALEYYLKSLKIKEEFKDLRGIALGLNNVGLVYRKMKNHSKARDYFEQSLAIEKEREDPRGIARCLLNLSTALLEENKPEQALKYQREALDLNATLGNEKSIAASYSNLAAIFRALQRYDSALIYEEKSLSTERKLGNQTGIATSLANLADFYLKQEQTTLAEKNAKEGLAIAQEILAWEQVRNTSRVLRKLYQAQKKFNEAFQYQSLEMQANDTLFSTENAEQIRRLQEAYELEKKELEVQVLRQKNEIQQLSISQAEVRQYALVGGILLSLFFVGLIYRNFLQKKALSQELAQHNEEIRQQNEEITMQRDAIENQRCEIETQNQKTQQSIAYASRIQASILPTEEKLNAAFPHHFVLFRPRDVVSGDFYWYAQQAHYHFLAVVDCTGHGVPGAFMSMIGNDLLNEIVLLRGITQPEEILKAMDEGVRRLLQQETKAMQDGMDLSLIRWEASTRELCFAGAKNELLLKTPESTDFERMKGSLYAIGGKSPKGGKSFTASTRQLPEGSQLYLFSDGFQDQFGGPEGRKFMKKHFRETLLESSTLPEAAQVARLEEILAAWRGKLPQTDDILVIGLRV